MTVRELPPSESFSSSVSVESRYGICFVELPFPELRSASAAMQLPSAESDLLIAAPSFRRVPLDPAASDRSEPARSTSDIRLETSEPSFSHRRTLNSTMVCARDDPAFMFVAATVLAFAPRDISASTSA